MSLRKDRLFFVALALILVLGRLHLESEKQPTRPPHVEAYLQAFGPAARELSRETGVPAEIILAVGCLESGWGESELAKKGNNHFGIKAYSTPRYCMVTKEYIRRKPRRIKACFKAYEQAEDSFRDFSRIIAGDERYQGLFQFNRRDYEHWADGLQTSGYATDPRYARKLVRLIRKYRLDLL
ncbi:MAG TPA: glucosaminidase domain-containing protein [Flavilitoribacter sp.]|nr:glucosaminidase domain-containing protein [Flavilitoribacter sp.]HMQ88184.1 glucosaminidase domain-containing protein [Flavilitoribacter sp.]